MNPLVRHIEFLLRKADVCVVVPGIGAIISHRIPARYDSRAGVFMPPSLEYSFNGSLSHSDGTLAASVARRKGISFSEASREVEEVSASMRRSLRDGMPLSLGRIGSLMHHDGRTVFIPFGYSLLPVSESWLSAVPSQRVALSPAPVQAEQADAISDETSSLADSVREAWRRTAIRASKVAASVALVVALGFAIATTLGRTAPEAEQASLGFDFHSAVPASESSVITRPGTSSSPLVLVLRSHEDAVTSVDTASRCRFEDKAKSQKETVLPQDTSVVPAARDNKDRYCLVIASLASRAEAERFIASRSGDLRILESNGRFRIYAASAASPAEVRENARLLGLDSQYPDAWVCKK